MRVFKGNSLEELYPQLLVELIEEGEIVSPRGIKTREISPATIVINNPKRRFIPSAVRKLNIGFSIAEPLWIMAGRDDTEMITHYNKNWLNFSDDGVTLNGAYGRRIFRHPCVDNNGNLIEVNQFKQCYELLKKDKDSRQATIVLFNPYLDGSDKITKDRPCTNIIRYSIRNNKLNALTIMRSQDVVKGTVYDIPLFTMLQEVMAGLLGIEVGKYTHVMDSFHIYESDIEWMKDVVNEKYPSLYEETGDFDGRILGERYEDFEFVLNQVMCIEYYTRKNKNANIFFIIESLNKIENEVWRSYAAIIATYNLRKYRRTQEELDMLYPFITNEYKDIFKERYRQLF